MRNLARFWFFVSAAVIVAVAAVVVWQGREGQPAAHKLLSEARAQTDEKPQPSLYILKEKHYGMYGFQSGLIAFTSVEKPAVVVGGYNIAGRAELTLYRLDEQELLRLLTHDGNGKLLNPRPDMRGRKSIARLQVDLRGSNRQSESGEVLLPLEQSGIYLLQISLPPARTHALLVRSVTGVAVSEGEGKFIFWGQDFASLRSVTSGKVVVYSLRQRVQKLAEASFNHEGIATAPLKAEADVALVSRGRDHAIVPLNLKTVSDYAADYKEFIPQRPVLESYVFTDRPLYRPGDTVHFKAILRHWDDERFTVTHGFALVRVYKEWYDWEQPIFEHTYPISSLGTVSGEFKLPRDVRKGWYVLGVEHLPDGRTPESIPRELYGYPWQDARGGFPYATPFRVEHYRKPEYFLEIKTPRREIVAGEEAVFSIEGKYFFGEPLRNQKVSYVIYARGEPLRISEWDLDESMVSAQEAARRIRWQAKHVLWWSPGKEIQRGTVRLDERGRGEVRIKPDLRDGVNTILTLRANLGGDSADSGGIIIQPTTGAGSLLVWAGRFNIFVGRGGSFGGLAGDPLVLPLELLPVAEGGRVDRVKLTLRGERTWYENNQEKKEEFSLGRLVTNAEGKAVFRFVPAKAGSYEIQFEARDRRGNLVRSTFNFWVPKKGSWDARQKEKRLSVKPDKKVYAPGETARLIIVSAIPNRDVLLSLERARVSRFRVVRLRGHTATVKVPLLERDMPDVFVRVYAFSGRELDRALEELAVSAESKRLRVGLKATPPRAGPGETVAVELRTANAAGKPVPAEVAVWAVDKALFELMSAQRTPIFKFFWGRRHDHTGFSDSLLGIRFKTAGRGGCFAEGTPVLMADGRQKKINEIREGDWVLTRRSDTDGRLVPARVSAVHRSEARGYLVINGYIKVTPNHRLWVNGSWRTAGSVQVGDKLLNAEGREVEVTSVEWRRERVAVFNLAVEKQRTYFAAGIWAHNLKEPVRLMFKDVAYWNPAVRTNEEGRAVVRFTLPDNLTTWVITAVGVTGATEVGEKEAKVVVSKEVVLRPALPNILRVGDRAELAAVLHNFSGKDRGFEVSLKFSNGRVAPARARRVKVKAGESRRIVWRVEVNKGTTPAELTFSARNGDVGDTVLKKIPVKTAGLWDLPGGEGYAATKPTSYKFKLAKDALNDQTRVELSLSPSLAGPAIAAAKYLLRYPFGCVEQTLSSMAPIVLAKRYPELFGEALRDFDVDKAARGGLERLAKFQNDDGGWGWWERVGSSEFITAYVVEMLFALQDVGIQVNKEVLNAAEKFFERKMEKAETKDKNLDERIVLSYGLSFFKPKKKLPLLTGMREKKISPDLEAMAVLANVRNGYRDPRTNGLADLLAMARRKGNLIYWSAGDFADFGAVSTSTGRAVQALLAAGGPREVTVKAVRFLAQSRRREYWSHTFATTQALRALAAYMRAEGAEAKELAYQVLINGREFKRGRLRSSRDQVAWQIPLTWLRAGDNIVEVRGEGADQLYSTLVVNKWRAVRRAKSRSNGITIERRYLRGNSPATDLQVGDEVTVELKLRDVKENWRYLVIEDKLPSGMVPLNPVFRGERKGDESTYGDYYTNYEVEEDGVVIFDERRASAGNVYRYRALVVSAGSFIAPPAEAFLMYIPEVWGRTSTKSVKLYQPGARKVYRAVPIPWEKWGGKPAFIFFLLYLGVIAVFALFILSVALYRWRRKKQDYTEKSQLPPSPPP
jgi:hypothetical protein